MGGGGRPSAAHARPALVQGEDTEARSPHAPAQGQARSGHRRGWLLPLTARCPRPRPQALCSERTRAPTPPTPPPCRPRAPGDPWGLSRTMEAISPCTACMPALRCSTNMFLTGTACVPVMPSWCCTCGPTRGSRGPACPLRAGWALHLLRPGSRSSQQVWAEGALTRHRRRRRGEQLARAFLTLWEPADFGEKSSPPLGAPGIPRAQSSVPALRQGEMQTAPCGCHRARRAQPIMALDGPHPLGGHVSPWHREGLGLRTSRARGPTAEPGLHPASPVQPVIGGLPP